MRGLYLAEGAMLTQQAQLQVISNNMANLRTAGFKRDHAVETSFAEWMIYELRPAPERGGGGALRPVGSMAHNVATSETMTSFADGPLEATNRSLDFAIIGGGFFQVEGDEGVLLTKNGRFTLNEEGFITTIEGYLLLGEGGAIQLEGDQITMLPDGTIYQDGDAVDTLAIVSFGPDAGLEKIGYNYFEAAGGEEEGEFTVLSGFLEGSNASLTREMLALMTVRRSYEAAQKVMITYDGILDKAANELGSLA